MYDRYVIVAPALKGCVAEFTSEGLLRITSDATSRTEPALLYADPAHAVEDARAFYGRPMPAGYRHPKLVIAKLRKQPA